MIKCLLARDWKVFQRITAETISQILKSCRGYGGSYDLVLFCLTPGGEYFWNVYRIDDDTGQLYEYYNDGIYPINTYTVNMDYAKYSEQFER